MSDALKPAKHGRDHCPGGIDPIPCLPGSTPWIQRKKTASQSISNGTNDTEITWAAGSTGSTTPDYTDYFSIVTPTDKTIKILQAGVYEITAQFVWSSNKVEGSIISLNSTLGFLWNKGWYDEQNAGHTIQHNQMVSFRRRFPANTTLSFYVVHFASASRSVDSAWWEIQYVGSYTGDDPDD